ncbi:MAG: phenylacetate--CoA ligase PaaK [Sandaracinaceae bacterium]
MPRPIAEDKGVEPVERLSRDELTALQVERLQLTLRHAYDHVPHYRKAFDAAGVRPEDLRRVDDLARFPFTTKEDLRENYPFGMFAVPRERVARVHASSGTTGRPTVVGYTKRDITTWASVMARSLRAAGARPGDLVHVAYGYGLFTGGLGAHYGAEHLGCTVVPMGGGNSARQVRLIQDFAPSVILVTPSYMLALADAFERAGIDPRATSLNIGIFGAEPWTEGMRRAIEERFDMHAVDIYGLSEVIGPGVSNEFVETKDGPHVWEDHFYPEVIDPDTLAPAEEGVRGELVFTSLTKEAFPIVRYRTRDLSRLLPGTMRVFRRMERVTGRTDDMLIVRGVNCFPTQFEELVLEVTELAPHYVLEVSRDGALDRLVLKTELAREAIAVDRDGLCRHVVERIRAVIGLSAEVHVLDPESLERSLGKAKRVLDRRG